MQRPKFIRSRPAEPVRAEPGDGDPVTPRENRLPASKKKKLKKTNPNRTKENKTEQTSTAAAELGNTRSRPDSNSTKLGKAP